MIFTPRLLSAVLVLALSGSALVKGQVPPGSGAEAAAPASAPAPEPGYVYWAKVAQILDGGTVLLNIDLGFDTWVHKKVIRLSGVTAPSVHGSSKEEGLRWKTRLSAILPVGADVILKSTKDENDKSGNPYLGTLWLDGKNVNEALLAPHEG